MQPHDTTNPNPKLCECGCGQPAKIATKTQASRGHIKGQPVRFLPGHNPKRDPKPIEERFWAKVNARGHNECWEWQGSRDSNGYGQIRDEEGRNEQANRISYRLHHGPIPDGFDICHSCDNPPCVNPAHLWAGTRAENLEDMDKKGRRVNYDRHGEKNPRVKLTEADVIMIRQLEANGIAPIEIATQFGVTLQNISRIVHRRTWVHI